MTISRSSQLRGYASLTALLCLIPLSAGVHALDRRKDTAWHALAVWRQPQGLPQDTVLSLLQTRDGYLWVGTKGGVSRFDGVRFTTFDDRNTHQLRESEIWALAEGDDSSVWIGTYGGGLSRFKDGTFTVYTTAEGLVNDFVTTLGKDNNGGIWIGTDGGLSRFKEGRFTNYTVRTGLAHDSVRGLYVDTDGSVLIGSNRGDLTRFNDGRLSTVHFDGPSPSAVVGSIYRDREQALWIGAFDGLFRIKDGRSVRYTSADGLSSNRIHFVGGAPAGHLVIGTDNGLDQYKDGAFTSYVLGDGNTSEDILAHAVDREGSLWLGYRNLGLACVRRGHFVSYTKNNGLADDYVATVLEDRNSTLWIGTAKGLSAFRGGAFTTYGTMSGLPEKHVASLAEDGAGTLWVGTSSRSPTGAANCAGCR